MKVLYSSVGPGELKRDATDGFVQVNGANVLWFILEDGKVIDPGECLTSGEYNIVISDKPEPLEDLTINIVVKSRQEAADLEKMIGKPPKHVVDKINNLSYMRMG